MIWGCGNSLEAAAACIEFAPKEFGLESGSMAEIISLTPRQSLRKMAEEMIRVGKQLEIVFLPSEIR
jgi:hypothetical protein